MALRLLVLRITEKCGLACRYCYADHGKEKKDMSFETAAKAAALACPKGGSLKVQLTGGEPLINFALAEKLKAWAAQSGRKLSFALQTNATLIDAAMAERIKALGCSVGVSLDGYGASNALRKFPDGTESFKAAAEGVRNLAAAGVFCNLMCVVTKHNAERLGELADLALYLGNIKGIGLDLVRPFGRAAGADLSPDPKALAKGAAELSAKLKDLRTLGIDIKLREEERIKRRAAIGAGCVYCYAQTADSVCVDPAGDIWPCSGLASEEGMCLGNIKDYNEESPGPFAGSKAGRPEIARTFLAPPQECRSCESFATCLGGCPAGRTGEQANKGTCVLHNTFLKGASL